MHTLNKLINAEISSARFVCNALSTCLKHLMLHESDDTVKNVNEFAMLLMFIRKSEDKSFSCNISVFL